jgi:hypothetical protein
MRGLTRSIRASRNIDRGFCQTRRLRWGLENIALTPQLQPGDLDALIESNRLNGFNAFQAVETAFS